MHRFLPALVRREGGRIASVPVNHRARTRGRSNYRTLDRLAVAFRSARRLAATAREPSANPVRDGGSGPPVAQSSSSTVWTIGSAVAAPSWVIQPILPVAMRAGRTLSILTILRSRSRVASSGWRIL